MVYSIMAEEENIIPKSLTESKRKRWAGHVARKGIYVYTFIVTL
jgi:hypothetical protein